ncbi:MAG: M23 family metallopeptidase [Thiohalorhabdus sp.]|uniref:M23 family metallopeptidase n=1 Tax=Thiohalorhabdus sp. TaxID=3094134 RepID=UPI00397FCB8F
MQWEVYELKKGETLSQMGERVGLGARTTWALARASQDVFPVQRMRSGRTIRVHYNDQEEPEEIRYGIDSGRYLAWRRQEGGEYEAAIEKYPRTEQIRTAHAEIDTSLLEAGARAGLPEGITMELARIFGWDIDFAHDLRKGDWFRILYKEYYRDGEKVGNGPILAAEFVTRGESHKAIRFTDAAGNSDYYTPAGRSVRKAFLRNPMKVTRITSRFTNNRDHPVLEERRAHKGVDYGAPTGTPIRATGDGRVVFRGRKGGYGNVVMLRHAGQYTTVYAHMSRFGKFRKGQRVKQGQTVGYVGQSGLATGPHLHYEFRVNGNHRNPLTVELPEAEPLPDEHRADFDRRRHHLTAWLEAIGEEDTRMAATE